MLELNDLLAKLEIEPRQVLIMRHRPTEPGLRRVLPWYAVERPELFNAYQRAQGSKNAETALSRATFLASFIGLDAGTAHFAGLYKNVGSRQITREEYFAIPENQELHGQGISKTTLRSTALWFELEPLETLSDLQGRLVIDWTGIERSWYRWANRNDFPINSILSESTFVRGMPEWTELVLSWLELKSLPVSWQKPLAEWRGVYLITDKTDGKQYVGSAGGSDQILGRWLNYARSGHGGNKLLRERDPANFSFSILQRVAPDMEPQQLVAIENSWKTRLGTREFGMNSN